MRIIDLLKTEAITLGVSAPSKEEAIRTLVSLHEGAGNLADAAASTEALLAREALGRIYRLVVVHDVDVVVDIAV